MPTRMGMGEAGVNGRRSFAPGPSDRRESSWQHHPEWCRSKHHSGALRDHGRPSACRSDGYIFFGSVKPPSFRAFSSTGMPAAEALWHVLSAVATDVEGSVSK